MTELINNIDIELIANIASGLANIVIGLFVVLVARFLQKQTRSADRLQSEQVTASETSAQRIRRLTAAMTEAAQAVEEIQSEIREKHNQAEKLREEIEKQERLRQLNESEVQAVLEALEVPLKEKGVARSGGTSYSLSLG